MGANAQRPTVTMRHPKVKNPLVCFDIQVEHHESLGWKVVTDDSAPAKPAPTTAASSKTTDSKEG